MKHPRKPVEYPGQEAAEANKNLVKGKTVRLGLDVQQRDHYGRLLAYVYVGDVMVNAELVRLGYAQVATFPPNVRYQGVFLKMKQQAQAAQQRCEGSWS
jgi:micrococcal nuclease